jgi:hypothetical protein
MKLTPEQRADRFRNRSKMAWLAFCVLVFGGAGLHVAGLSSDHVVDRLVALRPTTNALFTALTALVLAYFGASSYENTRGGGYEHTAGHGQ